MHELGNIIFRSAITDKCRVRKFLDYIPAGTTPDGRIWPFDCVEFLTDPGGMRTVRVKDIVSVDTK